MEKNYLMVDDKENLELIWDALFEVEKHLAPKHFDLIKTAMHELEETINKCLEITEHQ